MLRDVTRVDDGAESSWRQTASATFGVAYLPGPARPGRLLAEDSPQASSSFRFLVFYAVFKVGSPSVAHRMLHQGILLQLTF